MRIGSIMTAVSLLLAACGGGAGGGDGDGGPGPGPDADVIVADGPYLPFETGSTWTYRVTDTTNASVQTKVSTVGDLEDVGGAKAGVIAHRVTTQKANGETTTSWQEDTGAAIIRHRERALDTAGALQNDDVYQPHKLRIDESSAHTAMGASWTETYTETVTDAQGATTSTTKTELWTVEAVDELVTVPAGTFRCLRVRKTSQTTASNKVYWFARGVGKVKEVGMTDVEELADYSLP
jgi:hypothetical protein